MKFKSKEASMKYTMCDNWDLIQNLLDHNLYHILTAIMLHLDPVSLKCAERVCKSWRDFVQEHLWRRKRIRKYLQENHLQRWKQGMFKQRKFQVFCPENISACSLACDDHLVVVGLTNGTAKVFHINTGAFKFILDCRREKEVSEVSNVTSDINELAIAAVTSLGQVSVWNRQSFLQLYKKIHNGCKASQSVKISGNLIILAGGDAVEILSLDGIIGSCQVVYRLREFGEGALRSVDCDGQWLVTGSNRYIKLWSLESCQCASSLTSGCVYNVLLQYPFCFAIGRGSGVGIWDFLSGQQVKTFGEDNYWQLHINSKFMVASYVTFQMSTFQNHPNGTLSPLNVSLFDIRDRLTSGEILEDGCNIEPGAVWNMEFPLPHTQFYCSAVNMTVLLVLQDNAISVWDFWTRNN